MSINYSYEMWVPEERLYMFLKVVQQNLGENYAKVFGDFEGRSAELFGSKLAFESFKHFKQSFYEVVPRSLEISLLFELDEVLSQSDVGFPINDKYEVGIIWLSVELSPLYINWLDNEETYARVNFSAHNSSMSEIFLESPSIRRGFINLVREGGASSCCFDFEEDYSQLIFLDAREVDEKIEIVDKQNYQLPSLREMRFQLDPTEELSENENTLSICQNDDKLSLEDILMRIDWAKNSEDSGVRGAAIKSLGFWLDQLSWRADFNNRAEPSKSWLSRLSWLKNKDDDKKRAARNNSWGEIESAGVEKAMCEIALQDNDWRVRYVATDCLEKFTSEQSKNLLSRIANDENQAVRTLAEKILTKRK